MDPTTFQALENGPQGRLWVKCLFTTVVPSLKPQPSALEVRTQDLGSGLCLELRHSAIRPRSDVLCCSEEGEE